jgi:uncharacterized protein
MDRKPLPMKSLLNHSHKLTAADVLARYNDEWLPDFGEPITHVNQTGSAGNRPIHIASYRGNLEEMEALVEGGAEINVSGDMGSTPLHDAIEQGHTEIVKFLLDHGARTDVKNEFGRTALDIAELAGRAEIVDLLVGGTGRTSS